MTLLQGCNDLWCLLLWSSGSFLFGFCLSFCFCVLICKCCVAFRWCIRPEFRRELWYSFLPPACHFFSHLHPFFPAFCFFVPFSSILSWPVLFISPTCPFISPTCLFFSNLFWPFVLLCAFSLSFPFTLSTPVCFPLSVSVYSRLHPPHFIAYLFLPLPHPLFSFHLSASPLSFSFSSLWVLHVPLSLFLSFHHLNPFLCLIIDPPIHLFIYSSM